MTSQPEHDPAISTCPSEGVLKQMVNGTLSETEELAVVRHLDSCSGCQIRIEQIAVGSTSILEAAKSAKLETPPEVRSAFWPALKQVETELKTPIQEAPALSVSATTLQPSTVDSSVNRPKVYAFLDTTEEPEYLGRIDRFKIVELVGKGGMGMVFRAFDSCLQRTVAIKVLDPQYATNEQAQNRFCREARAAAGVMHENVVTIHHVEHVEERNLSYIVMQFVKGRSLQELLDQGGRLNVREAIRIAASTASGLAAAHANGLIHRDIKPGNILLEQSTNRILLTDFGLARLNEDVKITQTGFVAGTPLYMSPEQAKGEQLSASSDLFSLGGVLYAMLTGNPPFQGSSAFVVLRQVTEARHRPVQDVNHEVPAAIAEIVDRLLEKNPKNRFKDAAEVAEVLQNELAKMPLVTSSNNSRRSSRLVPAYARGWWRRYSPMALAALLSGLSLVALLEAAKVTKLTVLGQRGQRLIAATEDEKISEPMIPPLYVLGGKDGAVWSVAFNSKSELLATASEGGMVRFFDALDGKERGQLNNEQFKSPVWAIDFSADDSKIMTAGDDGHVRIWDVKSKEQTLDIDNEFPVRSAVYCPMGQHIASGSRNGMIRIWDANKPGRFPLQSFEAHQGSIIMSLAFSPDGKLLVSGGSDSTVKVWNVKDGKAYTTFRKNTGPVYAVAFSPDGKTVISAGWDHEIRLYDVENAVEINSFKNIHADDIWALAYSPDGKHIITAGQDRTSKWIDAKTGVIVKTFRGHGGPVHDVIVSKDGKRIATSGRDGTVRVWKPE